MNRFDFWWRYFRKETPWDTQIVPPEITGLADRLPAGRALDIGCGTGTSALYLAGRGWQVTGIDFIPGAIRRAREKAHVANLNVDFRVADVTRLDFLLGTFDLAFDIGCLHSLPLEGQERYAAQLSRLTRTGATYALYAFDRQMRGGREIGLSAQDVTVRFSRAFVIISAMQGRDKGNGPSSAWYYLRRQ